MTQLSIVRADIAEEITRTDLSSKIDKAINKAIKLWEAQRFGFNERRYTINTVASQEYYDIISPTLLTSAGAAVPTGEAIIELDAITATVNNAPYPLTPRTQQWFNLYQAAPTQFRGAPDSYGFYGDQLRIFPVPDAVYTLTLSAHARLGPNPLSNDSDTNAWLTEGELLIREQAKVMLFRFPLKNADGAALAQQAVDQAFASLERKRDAKVATGRMGAWTL